MNVPTRIMVKEYLEQYRGRAMAIAQGYVTRKTIVSERTRIMQLEHLSRLCQNLIPPSAVLDYIKHQTARELPLYRQPVVKVGLLSMEEAQARGETEQLHEAWLSALGEIRDWTAQQKYQLTPHELQEKKEPQPFTTQDCVRVMEEFIKLVMAYYTGYNITNYR